MICCISAELGKKIFQNRNIMQQLAQRLSVSAEWLFPSKNGSKIPPSLILRQEPVRRGGFSAGVPASCNCSAPKGVVLFLGRLQCSNVLHVCRQICQQKSEVLEEPQTIESCRRHWLRLGWIKTIQKGRYSHWIQFGELIGTFLEFLFWVKHRNFGGHHDDLTWAHLSPLVTRIEGDFVHPEIAQQPLLCLAMVLAPSR